MSKLFGTNGIRGVVNEDMNTDLALGIGKAWGTLLRQQKTRPKVAIGTDARLSNTMLKTAISAGLLATGCDVTDVSLVPTPTLQYTVREQGYDSGVIITASHNPPQFNGIKGVAADGTEFSKDVENAIEDLYFTQAYKLADWKNVGALSTWDGAIALYINGILKCVDVAAIKKKKYHIVLDCGNGAGSLVTPILLKKLGCTFTPLFCEPDGTFPGRNSEPIPDNLSALIKAVPEHDADFGIAQDGDADRAIFVDEHGTYVWGDQSLALAGRYLTKQAHGGIAVTPVTTSTCFEDVIKENGGQVVYTAVGSPIVARVMMERQAIFGGEENGGLIFPQLQVLPGLRDEPSHGLGDPHERKTAIILPDCHHPEVRGEQIQDALPPRQKTGGHGRHRPTRQGQPGRHRRRPHRRRQTLRPRRLGAHAPVRHRADFPRLRPSKNQAQSRGAHTSIQSHRRDRHPRPFPLTFFSTIFFWKFSEVNLINKKAIRYQT